MSMFLIWLGVLVVGSGLLWLAYTIIGPLFLENFMKYEVQWHEANGFCNSHWCKPQKLTYKSTISSRYNDYSPTYREGDTTNKEKRIRTCCVESAKRDCKTWITSWWSHRTDSKAMSLYSSIDNDRKELLALRKRDEKILEDLRNNPKGTLDMALWQREYDIASKELH